MLPVAEHSACSRVNGRLVPVDERSMICAGGQGKVIANVKIPIPVPKTTPPSLITDNFFY